VSNPWAPPPKPSDEPPRQVIADYTGLERLIAAADACELSDVIAVCVDRYVTENPNGTAMDFAMRMVEAFTTYQKKKGEM
jgi:hypothetical protein